MIANIFTTLAKALRGDNKEHRTFVDWTDGFKAEGNDMLLVTLHSSLKEKDYQIALPDTEHNRVVLKNLDKNDGIKAFAVNGVAVMKNQDDVARPVSIVDKIEGEPKLNPAIFPPFTPFG